MTFPFTNLLEVPEEIGQALTGTINEAVKVAGGVVPSVAGQVVKDLAPVISPSIVAALPQITAIPAIAVPAPNAPIPTVAQPITSNQDARQKIIRWLDVVIDAGNFLLHFSALIPGEFDNDLELGVKVLTQVRSWLS